MVVQWTCDQDSGFDSGMFYFHVPTLGKLFTHMCLCHLAVSFGTSQRAVMAGKVTDRSGVALRHRLSGVSTYQLSGRWSNRSGKLSGGAHQFSLPFTHLHFLLVSFSKPVQLVNFLHSGDLKVDILQVSRGCGAGASDWMCSWWLITQYFCTWFLWTCKRPEFKTFYGKSMWYEWSLYIFLMILCLYGKMTKNSIDIIGWIGYKLYQCIALLPP